ncbi:MAG: DUF885 domain-containing protein [Sedimentisphaerales bacterium]
MSTRFVHNGSNLRRVLCAMVMSVLAVSNFSCSGMAGRQSEATRADRWNVFVEDFLKSYFAMHPVFAVNAGLHEYDGQLPDWSKSGLDKITTWLHSQRVRAQAFDASILDKRQRFERDYLVSIIDGELFWLESAQWPYKNPYFYNSDLDPAVYVSREYAPLKERMRAYITYAEAVPTAVEQIRNNLRTPLPRTYVEYGRMYFGGLASFYQNDVPKIFASVADTQLQAHLQTANASAIRATKEMDAWFEAQQQDATSDFAMGSALFRQMLWATERIDIPLERLKEIGQRDLERNLAALREACEAYAPGESIEVCVERLRADKPQEGPVEAARRQLNQLKAFVIEKNLVSIPGKEEAIVKESPPYQRWNYAYIDIPGPYEKNVPSIYYIAPPDPCWTQKEQQDYIPGKLDLLVMSSHEVWPGHFLQFLHSNRAASKLAAVFVGYGFAEGWAHYSEEMMWDAGLGNGDPETHIAQLLEALLRNVRFISSIGLHTGGMTVEESQQMFREKAYMDSATAKQQAARGTFDPEYINYTLNKLMVRKLREDWTASRGGRDAWRAFHDEFLSYGGPPIPLVRSAMLGEKAGPPL